MTSAPPKAVKAFITEVVKDQILEASGSTTSTDNDILIPWLALLKMELVQRGVLVTGDKELESASAWDATKTLEAVRNSIGKALTEQGGTLPTPLLTASAVVAGRVADMCATNLTNETRTNLCKSLDRNALQSALQRCQEITDPRFQALLELSMGLFRPEDVQSTASLQTSLFRIAQGYFLRGTRFNPDVPQMWKKAYEVVLKRYNLTEEDVSPGAAAEILSNMARIATSKGNAQRAVELTLRVAESNLQLALQSVKCDSTITTTKEEQLILDAFLAPYESAIKFPLEQAQEAVEACQSQISMLSPNEVFTLQQIQVQLALAQEEESIEEAAQQAYQQAQNRAAETKQPKGKTGSGTSTNPSSLMTLRQSVRNKHLGGNATSWDETKVVQLRDATLQRLLEDPTDAATSMRTNLATQILQRVFQRYRDRAKAILCKAAKQSNLEGWISLGVFLKPFLAFTQQALTNASSAKDWLETLSTNARTLIETYISLVPCVEWMMISSDKSNKTNEELTHDHLSLTHKMLSALLARAVQAKKDNAAASKVLKTSTEPLDVQIQQYDCASASVKSLIFMRQLSLTETKTSKQSKEAADDLKSHVELAMKMAQHSNKYQTYSMEYGTGFWNFLLAWSGLHQPCWFFCTAQEARLLWAEAQTCLIQAKTEWGRPISNTEQLLLDLGKADAESGALSGGLPAVAIKLYREILNQVPSLDDLLPEWKSLITSHSWIGLTRVQLLNDSSKTNDDESNAVDLAHKSLQELIPFALEKDLPSVYQWISPGATSTFMKFHITVSRQLVADALVRSGRAPEARQFLERAVQDSPNDAGAAFALGAFLLRDTFSATEPSTANLNAAKMQLLKAAKLNSRRAGPFALLGVWYEYQSDRKRALGCYSKALLLEPSHPVAGRGVIRLTNFDAARAVINAAVQTSSAVNGWAWRALGKHKVMVTGESDLGAVALLKALRCRDIDQPQNEALSIFFDIQSLPEAASNSHEDCSKEKAESWAELAFCYRRMGRYTAAIRGFHSSIEASGDKTAASVLCACAEAELSLGLAEDAAEKFSHALAISGPTTRAIAAYGQGLSLLSLARRDSQDGKSGSALGYIEQAIAGFGEPSITSYGCTQKLLGDLYSFGATLPPGIFKVSANESEVHGQIAFIKKGEDCYQAAVNHYATVSGQEDESILLRASAITDAAANILLQAQLTIFSRYQGYARSSTNEMEVVPEVKALYKRAAAEFRRAIEVCPDYGPSWSGLGCSLVFSEPLLAQHAFCRSIQLDNLAPDAYANLGFLYTFYNSFKTSRGVMDALTQVADSPMMWINRALMLERSAASDAATGNNKKAVDDIAQAADAYRAALQVGKHPSAMLGLALSCRIPSTSSMEQWVPLKESAIQDSIGYLMEYEGCMGSSDASASLGEKLLNFELTVKASSGEEDRDSVDVAKASVESKLDSIEALMQEHSVKGVNGFDAKLIRKYISSTEVVAEESQEVDKFNDTFASPPIEMSLARRISFEPQRGDLWVELAKQLFRDSSATSSRPTLQAAQAAASRAANMLSHQWTHPTGIDDAATPVVHQNNFSDALALKYWFGNLLSPLEAKEESQIEKPENEDNALETKRNRIQELQKALIICPTNKFARAALNSIVMT